MSPQASALPWPPPPHPGLAGEVWSLGQPDRRTCHFDLDENLSWAAGPFSQRRQAPSAPGLHRHFHSSQFQGQQDCKGPSACHTPNSPQVPPHCCSRTLGFLSCLETQLHGLLQPDLLANTFPGTRESGQALWTSGSYLGISQHTQRMVGGRKHISQYLFFT